MPTTADRGPGQAPRPRHQSQQTRRARTSASADARCSHLTQELQSQLDALAAHGIPREKIFVEKVFTRVRVRPKFEGALEAARQIKAHARTAGSTSPSTR